MQIFQLCLSILTMTQILSYLNLVLIINLIIISLVTSKSYDGFKVYEITPATYEQAQFLDTPSNNMKYDFWREGRNIGDANDVMVAPEDQANFERELTANGLKYTVVVENVERISSSASPPATPKPIIFIDAGIHCREWIAPPVALYIIRQLVENSTNAYLYQNIDWVIVPNLNPDGYIHTQKEDRLWRKNRRLTEGEACYGTDLNRNFDYFWMYDGASNNSCSNVYAGPEAFSEPETRAIRDWFIQNGQNVQLYLTFHSFGEMLLYPWGYATVLPDNADELQLLGEIVAQAINETSSINSSYVVNTSAIQLGPAAGGSDDWVKAVAGVELSYTVELPNGDAPYWFMLPARQILPVVQETFEGVKVFQNYIEEKFVVNAARTE